MSERGRLSAWDVVYAADMGIACLISYWIITYALFWFVDRPSDLLGGMWAVVATVFVFRETRVSSLSAGTARLIATCVSFALCLLYWRTGSLYPCIALHCVNNSIAFGNAESWTWQIPVLAVGSLGFLTLVLVTVRRTWGPAPAPAA